MTTDTLPKAASTQVDDRRQHGHRHRHQQGRRHDPPEHGHDAGLPRHRRGDRARRCCRRSPSRRPTRSFNRITIDGDTSTNDSFVVMATQQAGHARIDSLDSDDGRALAARGRSQVAQQLAQAIVRDGEGATKFITVQVDGGRDEAECRLAAYAIAHSPLVKTAFFASDPNLGRILAAVGYAGIADLDQSRIDLFLDDVAVVTDGGRRADYREEDGARVMKQTEITVRIDLKRGAASRHRVDLRPLVRLREDQRRLPELIRLATAPLTLAQLRRDRRLIWWWLPVGGAAMFLVVKAWRQFAGEPPPALYTTLDIVWIAVTFSLISRRTVEPLPEVRPPLAARVPVDVAASTCECGVCGHEMPEG